MSEELLRVEKINKSGGVNGQKLQLVIKDTAGDPAKAHELRDAGPVDVHVEQPDFSPGRGQ